MSASMRSFLREVSACGCLGLLSPTQTLCLSLSLPFPPISPPASVSHLCLNTTDSYASTNLILRMCVSCMCVRAQEDGLFFADDSAGGDGRYHMPEECDDGNLNNGDGCSSKCTIETAFECAPERIVYDDSVVSDRCFERKEPSLGFFRSLAPLDERSRSQGRGGGGAETLDWYAQITGVDGLLHIDKYKIPDSHYPRESGWFQAHLAATGKNFDTARLPGLFKVAEDVEISRVNTYQTLHLNPFSEACSGDDKDERSLNQWVGEIVANGRDRARTQTCKWILRPFGAGSITIDLTFNLRKHKDRLEIRDSGRYEVMGERGVEIHAGECSPCGFPMESDQYLPESTIPYNLASKFKGQVVPNFNTQEIVDSYSARMTVGPSVAVIFYSDSSDTDDGVPFAGLSDTLGPNAFRLGYRASAEMYEPPTTLPARRSSPSTSTTNAYSQEGGSVRDRDTSSERDTPSDSAAAASSRGRSTSSSGPREDRGELHRAEKHLGHRIGTVNIPAAPSSRVMIGDPMPPTSPAKSAKRQDSQDLFPASLELEFSDDWAWKTHLPKAFGTSAVRFVRQQDQECAEGKKDQLQGEWEGETTAQGLSSGVAEFVGNGQCQPAYSLIAAESNNIATSHDACLELCGSIAGSKCTFLSYAEGSGTCLLFSSCPGPLAGSSEYLTWEVPYDRFVKLTCMVRMLVRETQISAHIYACGGEADGIRRSFQEGFNDGTAYFTCKADRACTDPETFPCLFKETTTSFTYYRYYQFAISWTRRSPDRTAGLSQGLYTFSVADNGFLFSEKNLELPPWTLQVYLPEQVSGAYPNILDRFVPLVLQPSKAQVLNLKQSEVKHSLSMQALSSIYPRMVSSYKLCNSSVASLLAPGQAPACAALVKLLFPSAAVTNPSGLTSAKLAAAGAPDSECYEDMLYKLRKTADVCSTIWQECDERCITPVPECGGLGYNIPTSEGPGRFVARVTSDNILVRELFKKIVHLADAIFFLTTAAYGSRRGERCGVPFRDLVAKIPQLGACQVQEYLDSSVAGCYNNTPQHIMNAPFLVGKSETCSAACHKGMDALLDIYGCCTSTDRNAQAEWWQRVGHPRFRTFLVAWTLGVHELFISPSTSAEEDTCADSARAYIDCSLPMCKHDPEGPDPQWKGWMDYPPPCCRMECPGGATKSFPSSCSCICTVGFVGEWCNTTQTHVLAEIQITGISARSFEKKSKQDTLVDNLFPLVEVQREKIEIDFFQDASDGLPPLPAGARLDPGGGWARRAVVGTDGNEAGEGRRQIEASAAVIVRFRVLVQTERAGLRIAQLLSNPSKLQVALIEAGLVKGDRRKQQSVVNTFLPMTLDAKGMHLCDNVLYACPVFNTALNQTTADRVAEFSMNELTLAIIVICPVILGAVLYLCYIHFEKTRVLWPLLRMCCASCGEVGRKYSKRARDSLRRTTEKREKKRREEASPYITSSDFERMTAARRLRPEMHSEGLTAWCAERKSDVYAPTGAILFTRGSKQLKGTNVPSSLSARLSRGLRLGSPGLYSDLVFTPSSAKESSRQLDHMEGSRTLEHLERETERRKVDQVLELLRTKRFLQPEHAVTCLQEEYDLGLTHNVAQLAQVAALESTANVSAMPVSMYGTKRYTPASACTLTSAPGPVRLECNQTQSTAESEFQARQKNRQPIVTLGQGHVPPIMPANGGIAWTNAGGGASTGDSLYDDTAVRINRSPSESVERLAPASARAAAALKLEPSHMFEPSHPVPMTPAEVLQRWEACKKLTDSNTKRFTTHLRHPIHTPRGGGGGERGGCGGGEVDNVLYNSRNSANNSRVKPAVYMGQVPGALGATMEGDSLHSSLDSVSSTLGTPLTAEERGKRLKGLKRVWRH
jgi:cysteine-rich repeat protein